MKERKLIQRVKVLLCVFSILLFGFSKTTNRHIESRSIIFPYEWVGNIDKIKFNEPSGICFHSKRKSLFVVGDEGEICEIKTNGTLIKQKSIRHADFEGITHDPSTGLLYIAIEGEEKIIELDPENFKVLREFQIERAFNGRTLLKAGGQGIEAITFVPDPNHPQTGTFYVANQSFNLDNKQDISAVFEVELPLKSKTKKEHKAKILRYFSPGVIDLSGLYYDSATTHLFVISDATNIIFECTKSGDVLVAYAFPGDNQEGITVDDDGFMYIAQDSGGIIKIKWKRNR